MIAEQAADNAMQLREALTDVISSITAEDGKQPGEYAGCQIGSEDDGTCFLELMEMPQAK